MPCCSNCFSASASRCAGCGQEILDRVCNALGKEWHVQCFTCTVCKQPFDGKKVFEKAGKPYCEEHLISSLGESRRAPPPRAPAQPGSASSSPDDVQRRPGGSGSRRAPPQRRSTELRNPVAGLSGGESSTSTPSLQNRISAVNDRGPRSPSDPSPELNLRQQGDAPRRPVPSSRPFSVSNPAQLGRNPVRKGPQLPMDSGPSSPSMGRAQSTRLTQADRQAAQMLFQDSPESKLADQVIKDFVEHLPWFDRMWSGEQEAIKETCMMVLVKDLHDALVATKSSGPLQVKSWTRAATSLDVSIPPEQMSMLLEQIDPLHQYISHLMVMTYNLSAQNRQGCSSRDFSVTVSIIFKALTIILETMTEFCTLDVLKQFSQKTQRSLSEAPTEGKPIEETLQAAKSSLKPMRIHRLVVQNIRNTLENFRSMTIQLISSIHCLQNTNADDLVPHRRPLEVLCSIRNMMSLTEVFLAQIATLFALEKGGLVVQQQPRMADEEKEKDVSLWEPNQGAQPDWPEKSGTLNSLILTLTSTESFDSSFQKCFITTYRSFTSPERLFSKLMQRYFVPASAPVDAKQVQIRVAIILKYWFETQIRDFDDMLIKELYQFITVQMKQDGHTDVSNMLKNALDQAIEKDNRVGEVSLVEIDCTMNSETESLTDLFLSGSAREIAEQMTIISSNIYRTINLNELLSQAWSKPKTRHKSPNVQASIQRFNQFTYWVPTIIVTFERLRERSKAVSKFIEIAQELQKLQNYDGVMSIIAGLTMSSVDRLKITKVSVPENLLTFFEKIEDSMQPNHSWRTYREMLHACTTAAVPYLGMFLTDLTFIEDGNPDHYTTPSGTKLINFKKREMVYKVLQEVQVYQSQSYPLQPKEPFASYLRCLPFLDEETLYDISLQREPRGASIKDLIT